MSAKKQRLVVVGNGMIGMRTVEEALKRAPGRYDITVFGAEPHPNYNRILLSSVLAGEKTLEDIVSHPLAWYAERGVTLVAGDPVEAIDPAAPAALSVRAVSHSFAARKALDAVDLDVPAGSFTALLGLNGAGKTTLVSLITRLHDSHSGSIRVLGFDVRRESAAALSRLGVVFQARTLDLDLSLRENLLYHAALHGIGRRALSVMVTRSAMSRKVQTPGRFRPGRGGASGFDPVARISRS